MNYQHRFQVQAPLEAVAQFHLRSANMKVLTPPPVFVRVHQAPDLMAEGDTMAFTLWLGPLPLRWLARFENVSPTGFADRQVKGPAAHWLHRHSFVAIDEHTTEVVDELEIVPRRHLFWGPVGFALWLNLPLLFAFRAWKTRRLLEKG